MEAAVGKFQRFLDELPHPLAQNERFVLEIEKYTRVITVKKGDYLLRSGEICQNAYFINKGVFINQYIGEQGNVCVTGFSSDNQYLVIKGFYPENGRTKIYAIDLAE